MVPITLMVLAHTHCVWLTCLSAQMVQESVNPAYFVIGGIMGCVPVAYWLVVSCQVR